MELGIFCRKENIRANNFIHPCILSQLYCVIDSVLVLGTEIYRLDLFMSNNALSRLGIVWLYLFLPQQIWQLFLFIFSSTALKYV